MTNQPIISIRNLHKSFHVGKNNVEVLTNINLDIFEGEFVIILGPSGCGKSTLLNTIIGLEVPTEGAITVNKQNLFEETTEDMRSIFRRKNIGMVYQQPNWLKSLDVLENVEFPLRMTNYNGRTIKKRASNIIDLMGMHDYLRYNPNELSGGQQQRVSMARALVANPRFIIADEPTGNLDSVTAADVMNIFKYINDESRRTVIMVTHNLEYENYASKVVYMKDGKIEKIHENTHNKDKHSKKLDENTDLLEMALEGR